jgi:hypothetical protein
MINVDLNYFDCTSLDTEKFLEATLGDPIELDSPLMETFGLEPGDWLSNCEDGLAKLIGCLEGQPYQAQGRLGNTYNHEQQLSADFQWQVFAPHDCADYICSDDVYVAVEPHLGGDPRGNYGAWRLYKVDSLGESGFYDQVVGWHCEPLRSFIEWNSTRVNIKFQLFFNSYLESVEQINEQASPGYSHYPAGIVDELLKDSPEYSPKLKCFVGVLKCGGLVKLYPYSNLPY